MRPVFDSGKLKLFVEQWPVVIMVLADGATKQEYVGVLDAVAKHVEALHMPFVTITDSRRVRSIPPADVRRYIADWMAAHAKTTRAVGAVTIIDSALMRGALTALYWVFTPPTPQGVARDWSEAHAWAMERFRANHVPVPPNVANMLEPPY
jgi:hypothetical protein